MPKLSIHKINISRAPGFPRGMDMPETFGSEINVINGQNGAGKSTVARAIQAAIWRSKAKSHEVSCIASTDGNTTDWEFRVGLFGIQVLHKGQKTDFQLPTTPHLEDQYILSLEGLLSEKGTEIASVIARQSIGGYDIDACVNSMKYETTNKTRACDEYKRLVSARQAIEEEQKKHKELKISEDELTRLRLEKKEAYEASIKKSLLEKRLRVLSLLNARIDAQETFNGFPVVLSDLDQGLKNRLEELSSQKVSLADEIEALTRKQNAIKQTLETFQLRQPFEEYELNSLLDKKEEIIRIKQEIGSLEERIIKDTTTYSENLSRLDTPADFKINDFNLPASSKTERIYTQYLELHQEATQIDNEKIFLEEKIQTQEPTQDQDFEGGIKILSEWLKNGNSRKILPFKYFLLIILIVGAFYFFQFIWGTVAGALLLLIPILVILIFFLYYYRSSSQINSIESDYKEKNLKIPTSWTTPEVSSLLSQLIIESRKQQERQETRQRIEQINIKQNGIKKKMETLDKERVEFEQGLGVKLPSKEYVGITGLFQYVAQLEKCRVAWDRIMESNNLKLLAEKKLQDAINDIRGFLQKHGIDILNEPNVVTNLVEQIKNEEDKRENLQNDFNEARQMLDTKGEKLNQVTQAIADIYKTAKLEIDDRLGLEKLLAQIDDYNQKREHLNSCISVYNMELMNFEQDPHAEHYKNIWEGKDAQGIEESISQLGEQASRHESLVEIISKIEAEVNSKKSDQKLEKLLSEKLMAEDQLNNLFDRCKISIAGNIIGDLLKKEIDREFRPAVLEKADKYFLQFTAGRYSLIGCAEEGESFVLSDNETKETLSINELSAGTKVQLLLAVKLAFIESMENGIAFPLLIDEAFVNSDSVRSLKIMETFRLISKQRQVFYFTCRPGEVAIWKKMGEINPGSVKILELSSRKIHSPAPTEDYPLPEIHQYAFSEQMTHSELPKELKLSKPNLPFFPIQSLHLWFLIEDKQLLQDLLNSGVSSWGQLEALLEKGLTRRGLENEYLTKLREIIRGLERYVQLCSQGVSKAVNEQYFEKHPLKRTTTKLDEVLKLMRASKDAAEVIQRLRNRGILGLQTAFINDLEQDFIENGYISQLSLLSKDEVNQMLIQFCNLENIDIKEVIKVIERMNLLSA